MKLQISWFSFLSLRETRFSVLSYSIWLILREFHTAHLDHIHLQPSLELRYVCLHVFILFLFSFLAFWLSEPFSPLSMKFSALSVWELTLLLVYLCGLCMVMFTYGGVTLTSASSPSFYTSFIEVGVLSWVEFACLPSPARLLASGSPVSDPEHWETTRAATPTGVKHSHTGVVRAWERLSVRYGEWSGVGLGWERHAGLGDGPLPWAMSLWQIITMPSGLPITIILAPRNYNKMSVAINLKRGKVYFDPWLILVASGPVVKLWIMGECAAEDAACLWQLESKNRKKPHFSVTYDLSPESTSSWYHHFALVSSPEPSL